MTYKLILASGSPRRQELLDRLGLEFSVVVSDVDETPLPGETPAAMVQRLSRLKAQTVARHISPVPLDAPTLIIAADTDVVLAGKILGKPANPTAAIAMLKALRRQRHHHVYTGLTVAYLTGLGGPPKLLTRLHQTTVWLRDYSDAEIAAYVASGDPLDKAGAYAIQHDFNPVAKLDGCYTSVVGLPLGELAATMHMLGLDPPDVVAPCQQYTGLETCCQLNPLAQFSASSSR